MAKATIDIFVLDQAAVTEMRQLLLEATGLVGLANGVNGDTYQVGDPMPPAVREFAERAKAMIAALDAASARPPDLTGVVWLPAEGSASNVN